MITGAIRVISSPAVITGLGIQYVNNNNNLNPPAQLKFPAGKNY